MPKSKVRKKKTPKKGPTPPGPLRNARAMMKTLHALQEAEAELLAQQTPTETENQDA